MPTQNDDAWPISALTIFDRNRDRRVPLGSRIATEDRTTKSWATISRFRERHRPLRRSRARSTAAAANTSIWSPWPYTTDMTNLCFPEVKKDRWAHSAESRFRAALFCAIVPCLVFGALVLSVPCGSTVVIRQHLP